MGRLAESDNEGDRTQHNDEHRDTGAEHGPIEPERNVLHTPDRAEQRER